MFHGKIPQSVGHRDAQSCLSCGRTQESFLLRSPCGFSCAAQNLRITRFCNVQEITVEGIAKENQETETIAYPTQTDCRRLFGL